MNESATGQRGNGATEKESDPSVAPLPRRPVAPLQNGFFITLEGPEGGGKSTQIRCVQTYLERRGYHVRAFAEPGGTRISQAIRAILLSEEHTEMAPRAELLLFLAARAQLVEQEIRPALAEGCIVLCDRYTDSTLAYQQVGAAL